MITHHAQLARLLATELRLSDGVLEALGSADGAAALSTRAAAGLFAMRHGTGPVH